ncbi:MAG: transposase, partial [Rhodoferax sp.]|nr:transposase [Rhodoferax sp.]
MQIGNRFRCCPTPAQAQTLLQRVIEVPAFYSSQECGSCGHIHKDNRVSQSEFVCQNCGHTR